MADSYIQVDVDGDGKKMQTVENTVSGQSVHAEAVLLVDENGDPISTLPVTGALTDAQLRATAVAVSGTFYQATQPVSAASLPLPALASTSTKQSDGTQKTQLVDGSGNVIAATSNALHVNVQNASLTVASHAVTNAGTFAVQAAQSGTWTVQPGNTANTTAWKVDASSVAVPVTDNSGSLTVDGPLTDTELRATAVPISVAVIPSHAVTNAGTFAVQAACTNAGTFAVQAAATEADGANVTLGAKADAKSTATDTTPITAMSALKQVSASTQATVTALGSPFQAGGSIGNTSFTATQGTATNLKVEAAIAAAQTLATVTTVGTVTTITNTVPTQAVRSGTATTSQVSDTASNATLLALNANRLGASISNDSSAILYVKCGTTASTTDYTTKLFRDDYWEVPANYTGRIDGIWAADPNDGAARVTEFT